jgi:hypothetical protein
VYTVTYGPLDKIIEILDDVKNSYHRDKRQRQREPLIPWPNVHSIDEQHQLTIPKQKQQSRLERLHHTTPHSIIAYTTTTTTLIITAV